MQIYEYYDIIYYIFVYWWYMQAAVPKSDLWLFVPP